MKNTAVLPKKCIKILIISSSSLLKYIQTTVYWLLVRSTIALISSKCFEFKVGPCSNTRSCLNQAQHTSFIPEKFFFHNVFFNPNLTPFMVLCNLLNKIFRRPITVFSQQSRKFDFWTLCKISFLVFGIYIKKSSN